MNPQSLKLYAITDSRWLAGRSLADVVEQAVKGGATFMQLRQKGASTQELTRQAKQLIPICKAAGVPFVINDDVDAALASGADGVHVGQSDASCQRARQLLGPHAIVGVSAQTLQQAQAAEAAGASYVGVGAMFATSTKDAAVLSRQTLADICRGITIPVVAIGGITAQNAAELAGTGIAGVSVVSAIFAAENPRAATQELRAVVDTFLS